MRHLISAELSLATACCRWPPSPNRVDEVRHAAVKVLNWNRFEAVVVRNRIAPLVHHGLAQAEIAPPTDVAQRLSRRAVAAAGHALTTARESLRLQQTFETAGLPAIIFKGAPLAALAYRDLGMKESLDIDLLVAHESVPLAIELLKSLGYEGVLSRLKRSQIDGYLRHAKEASFVDRKASLMVDLHWRLIDSKTLLSDIGIHGPSQNVSLPGGQLRTLATEELFTYLCVHGSFHNWARLKWIADAGAFLSGRSHEEIEHLYATAERHGAARPALIALALCERLLGIELSEKLHARLQQSRIARALRANALAGLAYKGGAVDPGRYSEGRLRKIAAQFFAVPGLRHPLSQARFYWNFPIDRMSLALPPSLGFLYGVLRIPLWFSRLAAGAFGIRAARRN